MQDNTDSRAAFTSRIVLSVFYAVAGCVHLIAPERFLPIMPAALPFPVAIILFTGVCEIAGAIGLHIPRLRRLTGSMLALYAVAVFPANIKHAVEGITVPGLPDSGWYHGPRLAAQPLLILWTLWMTGWRLRRPPAASM